VHDPAHRAREAVGSDPLARFPTRHHAPGAV
jgi:hypothetical protein